MSSRHHTTKKRHAGRASATTLDAFLGPDALPPQEDYDAKFRDADRDDGEPAHDDGSWQRPGVQLARRLFATGGGVDLTSAGANFRGAGVDAAAEAAARSLCEPPFLLYVGGLPAHASADTARLLVEAHVARGEAVLAVRVSGQRRNEAGEYAIAFAEFESAATLLTAAAVPNVALPLAEGEPAWKQRRLTIDVATPEQKAAHAARVAEDAASRTTLEEVAFRTACSFRL
jgi:hypothetical protein